MANGLTEIRVPDLGGAKGVTVLELLVAPGTTVAKDTSLFVVEGDKATMEIPAPKAGVLVAFKIKVGDTVDEGQVVAEFNESAVSAPVTYSHIRDNEPGQHRRHKLRATAELSG